jgi:hypothetical protein
LEPNSDDAVSLLISAATSTRRMLGDVPRHKCPRCGSRKNATLQYGLPAAPTPEVQRELDLGRIAFAGCVVTFNDPRWSCNSCGALFGLPGEEGPTFTVVAENQIRR